MKKFFTNEFFNSLTNILATSKNYHKIKFKKQDYSKINSKLSSYINSDVGTNKLKAKNNNNPTISKDSISNTPSTNTMTNGNFGSKNNQNNTTKNPFSKNEKNDNKNANTNNSKNNKDSQKEKEKETKKEQDKESNTVTTNTTTNASDSPTPSQEKIINSNINNNNVNVKNNVGKYTDKNSHIPLISNSDNNLNNNNWEVKQEKKNIKNKLNLSESINKKKNISFSDKKGLNNSNGNSDKNKPIGQINSISLNNNKFSNYRNKLLSNQMALAKTIKENPLFECYQTDVLLDLKSVRRNKLESSSNNLLNSINMENKEKESSENNFNNYISYTDQEKTENNPNHPDNKKKDQPEKSNIKEVENELNIIYNQADYLIEENKGTNDTTIPNNKENNNPLEEMKQ